MKPVSFSNLSGLGVGEPLVHVAHAGQVYHVTVAKIGRVWLTDSRDSVFRIEDGQGKGDFDGRAYTVPDHELNTEVKELNSLLVSWGWSQFGRGADLTLDQLRMAARLLLAFEAMADPRLPDFLAESTFRASGCRYDETEPGLHAHWRGQAAHMAEDLVEVLRTRNMREASQLVREIARYVARYQGQQS